jgi:uncharacterized protein (DUF58 family)
MVRPLRPFRPVLGVGALLGVWWLVGHNSGAGWVQVIGDALAATLAVGLIGPAVMLRRARVSVVSLPNESTAGLPVELRVRSATRVRLRPLSPPGIEEFVGPVRGRAAASSPDGEAVAFVPTHRGVYRMVVVEAATAAPFALMWWARRIVVSLPGELLVAPRVGPPLALSDQRDDRSGAGRPRAPAQFGEPRGVREYHPGDNRRAVHWRATAHTGGLMIREMEEATAEPVVVTVTLPADLEAADRIAESALGTIVALLDRGVPVVLATLESNGAVVAPVIERREAGRRLARAIAAADRSTADVHPITVGDPALAADRPFTAGNRSTAAAHPIAIEQK